MITFFQQESIDYCQECLETIYLASSVIHPDVVVLENHFEPTFKPHVEKPTKVCSLYSLPPLLSVFVVSWEM